MNQWEIIARRKAKKYGLDPDIFARQINQESGFNPHVTSSAGAQGIAQIMPATAAGWGVNPNHPRQALDAAASHMAQYYKQYGNMRDALTAYNAGPGAVGGRLPAETQNYLKIILGGQNPTGGPAHVAPNTQAPQSAAPSTADPLQVLKDYIANTQHLFSDQPEDPGAGIARTVETLKRIKGIGSEPNPMLTSTESAGPTAPGSAPTGAQGTKKFEGTRVAAWIAPALQYAREHGWKGSVNSGWRSFAEQTRIYNSGVRPAARPGTSNHEGADYPRGAVDVSDAEQLSQILQNSPWRKKLVWAGAKDPVHFSHPHGGSY